MKKVFIYLPVFIIVTLCSQNSVHAQFLKNIINTVKQTAQNKASDKASQATNQAIDNAGNSVLKKSNKGKTSSNDIDTASIIKVLGAFGQAAQQNPNDTSSADVTMKALGILVGGGGVSAADSAEAIKRFSTAKGGAGFYYETVTISTSKKGGISKDTAKRYFTQAGEGRSEMRINIPGAMTSQFITLGNAGSAKYSVVLYPDTKTYALNIIDTSLLNSKIETYEVTKLGSENVQGFACTHVKLKSTTGRGMFKSSSTMELWTSPDVPGYSFIKKAMINQNVKPQMLQALEQNNCDGYIVKMSAKEKDFTMDMTLIKVEIKTFPASLFKIPSGYKGSNENMMYHMMSSGAKK